VLSNGKTQARQEKKEAQLGDKRKRAVGGAMVMCDAVARIVLVRACNVLHEAEQNQERIRWALWVR